MERTLNIKQKHSKDYQPPILLSSSAIESLFFLMLQKHKKTMKIHYTISKKHLKTKIKTRVKSRFVTNSKSICYEVAK